MPQCDACARHWTPPSMRADGTCPTCGRLLELRTPPGDPAAAHEAPEEEAGPAAPWHFKVMLLALAAYLAWRGVQGVGWVASHL